MPNMRSAAGLQPMTRPSASIVRIASGAAASTVRKACSCAASRAWPSSRSDTVTARITPIAASTAMRLWNSVSVSVSCPASCNATSNAICRPTIAIIVPGRPWRIAIQMRGTNRT